MLVFQMRNVDKTST
ncbi:TPA: 23S rRNA methyltransferase attenuation leader peptide, partial [Enterococcus faecium]|nr:23S rRNA methyltransferase attenuation leader peptide [Enterococcus faecium]HCU2102144.1 23S rRNA methyltransferase attenuation leader peptide [Enterococcus faecalis]HER3969048.1 23S rRNA methyltransferase attenuation leader peptide [Streptococcus pyogenes]HEU5635075.1 23S rRNA methyltransferase attenuation leader peptide [Streptococcus pneumoniae]HAZ0577312.1 23S rRNA methyltransferase attenuation leader peptide [Enterococcus faecium]